MGEMVDHRDGLVDLGFNVGDDEASFVWGVFWIVDLPLVVCSDTEYVGTDRVSVRTINVDSAVPGFLY